MADADNICDADGCNCATDGSDYCSPFCESASEGDVTAVACECGHPGCGQAAM